jgi:cysteine-S-conjugate beta-lyase
MKARIAQRNAGEGDEPITYGIYGTPTHQAFYDALNALEGGHRSWALPSGSPPARWRSAFVRSGDHVLIPTRSTGRRAASPRHAGALWRDHHLLRPDDRRRVEALFTPTTRVLFLEAPGSLTFEMQDVPLLAQIARAKGRHQRDRQHLGHAAVLPAAEARRRRQRARGHQVHRRPLGPADGHHHQQRARVAALREAMHNYGLTTSPDDCALALRGLRSMGVRLAQHRANAER